MPRTCPAEDRITVPAHTRCRPPGRGGRKASSRQTALRFEDDESETSWRTPRSFKTHGRKLFTSSGRLELTKSAQSYFRALESGKPRTKSQQNTDAAREHDLRKAQEAIADLAGGRRRPTMDDIDPRHMPADPCTGILYDHMKTPGDPRLKREIWQEQILGCALQAWCEQHDDECSDFIEEDTSFDPSTFSGVGRRTMPKQRASLARRDAMRKRNAKKNPCSPPDDVFVIDRGKRTKRKPPKCPCDLTPKFTVYGAKNQYKTSTRSLSAAKKSAGKSGSVEAGCSSIRKGFKKSRKRSGR